MINLFDLRNKKIQDSTANNSKTILERYADLEKQLKRIEEMLDKKGEFN